MSPPYLRETWLEISLGALAHNIAEIRRLIGPKRKLIVAAKGDAYGHGVVHLADTMMECGVDLIAVGSLDQAASLRETGFEGSLLLFGCCTAEAARSVIDLRCMPTLWDLQTARVYSREAKEPLPVAIKIDTGLHRLGVYPEEADDLARRVEDLPYLTVEGLYTHFANPIDDDDLTARQYASFLDTVSRIQAAGVEPDWAAAAASAVISTRDDMFASAVDPGRLIYGFYFPEEPPITLQLLPVATSLKSKVIQLKWVAEGESVGGYGRYFTKTATRIAVLPIGWGHGLEPTASGRANVLARGRRCPVLAVTLEHCIIDTTDCAGIEDADEVVIFGEQLGEVITLSEHARTVGLKEWEVMVNLGRSIPRRYFDDATIADRVAGDRASLMMSVER